MEEAEASESPAVDWGEAEEQDLLQQVLKMLPADDAFSFRVRLNKLQWSEINVANRTPDECRAHFEGLVKMVRTFRLLSEVTTDLQQWVANPAKHQSRYRHPDFPKTVLSVKPTFGNRYYPKVKEEHPDWTQQQIREEVWKMFAALSPEKLEKLQAKHEKQVAEYRIQLREFYIKHPEYKKRDSRGESIGSSMLDESSGKARRNKREKVIRPKNPKSPFQFFCESKAQPDDTPETVRQRAESLKADWEARSDKKKKRYILQALEDEQRYQAEVTLFQISNPGRVLKRATKRVTKAELKSLDHALGRPEPIVRSAYQMFCQEYHENHKQGWEADKAGGDPGAHKGWLKEAAAHWKDLSEKKRKKIQERYATELQAYYQRCEEYLATVPPEKQDEERRFLKLNQKKIVENGSGALAPLDTDTEAEPIVNHKKRISDDQEEFPAIQKRKKAQKTPSLLRQNFSQEV